MANHCSKCGKKLGILSGKYKTEDGTVMCAPCFKEWHEEQEEKDRAIIRGQEEKDRKIMKPIISKYLADKDPEMPYINRICCEAYWFASFLGRTRKKYMFSSEYHSYDYADDYEAINRIVLDKAIKERPECVEVIRNNMDSWFLMHSRRTTTWGTFLENCRYEHQEGLNDLESSIKSGLTTTELDEIKETIKLCEIILDFLDDLEKMGRLFEKKGIETTPFEMLSIFFDVIKEIANEEQNMPEQILDKRLDVYHELITKIIRESEEDITKESVIRVLLLVEMRRESEGEAQYVVENIKNVSELLKKFDFICEEGEAEQLIEQVKEEIELEEFEQNLETSTREISNVEREMIEKNKEIMQDYISKYLANKDQEYIDYILDVIDEWIDSEILEDSEVLDVIEEYNPDLHFHEDLEKFYNLFKKKGIETNYSEILSVFAECIGDRAREGMHEALEELDKYLNPMAKAFSMKFGKDITVENVIKEAMRKRPDIFDNFSTITHFLGKFQLDYEGEEIEQLMEQAKEEIELEEFEKNLGAPQQEPKNKIGDFTELNGYEFEEYLKNLFGLLGYTAVQTSLSGDQGADLILSKDDEKIVVQAKKYDGKVSNKAVQEIAAAKNYYEVDRAMIVTNSSFTKSAIELAFSNDVELWDGRKLKSVIKDLESKREDSGPLFHETLHFEGGEEVQNVTIPCPCCEKEFDYELDMHPYAMLTEEGTFREAGLHELEITCPHCDLPITLSFEVPLKPNWTCSFCGKEFETKAAAEEHEKTCEKRKEKD